MESIRGNVQRGGGDEDLTVSLNVGREAECRRDRWIKFVPQTKPAERKFLQLQKFNVLQFPLTHTDEMICDD